MAEIQTESSGNGSNRIQPKTFYRLPAILPSILSETQRDVDTRSAVEKCYGEDASIFGEEASATEDLSKIGNVIKEMETKIEDILRKEGADSKLHIFH